ncbi:NlpC/P60 family protein [Fontibacillus panacisegetis]|uniref:NlpC/P60 family protein n=1 Tax=Fontibacillus panacisegetis TaxID=670482 RepID=A0A1G7STH8_9BACL|nr:C40 family peptidase [Fontibacillus panacisegetis]SDG26258.1 NlpC/P60 family protein [Fontibacillus panacisegetis]
MRKRAVLALGLLCSLMLTSSCAATNGVKKQSVEKQETITTDNDADLYIGDLGVEKIIYAHRVRSLATGKQLVDPNGYPLIKQSPNPSILPIGGKYVENVIKSAKSFLGVPYVYGSDRTEPSSFDCSDFTRWVFLSAVGIDLPWDSRSQAAYVKAFSPKTYTSLKEAKRGDLLFFSSYRGNKASDYRGLTEAERTVSHLGIYLGNGRIIHCASKKSGGVNTHPLTWRQLNSRFLFGGGILSNETTAEMQHFIGQMDQSGWLKLN